MLLKFMDTLPNPQHHSCDLRLFVGFTFEHPLVFWSLSLFRHDFAAFLYSFCNYRPPIKVAFCYLKTVLSDLFFRPFCFRHKCIVPVSTVHLVGMVFWPLLRRRESSFSGNLKLLFFVKVNIEVDQQQQQVNRAVVDTILWLEGSLVEFCIRSAVTGNQFVNAKKK